MFRDQQKQLLDTLQEKNEKHSQKLKSLEREIKRKTEFQQVKNQLKMEDTHRRLEFVKNADLGEKYRIAEKFKRIEQL